MDKEKTIPETEDVTMSPEEAFGAVVSYEATKVLGEETGVGPDSRKTETAAFSEAATALTKWQELRVEQEKADLQTQIEYDKMRHSTEEAEKQRQHEAAEAEKQRQHEEAIAQLEAKTARRQRILSYLGIAVGAMTTVYVVETEREERNADREAEADQLDAVGRLEEEGTWRSQAARIVTSKIGKMGSLSLLSKVSRFLPRF